MYLVISIHLTGSFCCSETFLVQQKISFKWGHSDHQTISFSLTAISKERSFVVLNTKATVKPVFHLANLFARTSKKRM